MSILLNALNGDKKCARLVELNLVQYPYYRGRESDSNKNAQITSSIYIFLITH